jgi:Fe-S-cluster containining protein
MPTTQVIKIKVETPDGALAPAQVTVSDEPAGLTDLVPFIHELTSGVVALAVGRAERDGRKLSCRAGCGVCCCQLVPIAPAEAFYLVDRIGALPITERQLILGRFNDIKNRLAETGLIERIGALGETRDNDSVASGYFDLHLPCPFLVDQSCSIHEWRPIACREYNVTSPPEMCANPFSAKPDTIKLHRRMSSGLTRFCTEVAGLPLGQVPLPFMFDYHETFKSAASKTWPGVELFKQAMGFVLK